MLHTEYVRSLNCNYERILLDKKPEEKRYQYCILGRGGIKGLLCCSLRYINGLAYLYYDISSKQNVSQLYSNRCITREWMRDFVWGMKQIQQELGRFLLDTGNILWYPEQIFQDLESNVFSFLYVPYYDGESGFMKLVEFWVEHIDYDDEVLVDCVYHMYEQLERNGEVYLQSRIFEDTECLQDTKTQNRMNTISENTLGEEVSKEAASETTSEEEDSDSVITFKSEKTERKGILSIFQGKKQRNKKQHDDYREAMQAAMHNYAVAEETIYDAEGYGQTIFIEEKADETEKIHRLYTPDDRLVAVLEKPVLSIGKKKGEVDVVLGDASVSRIHARIIVEKGNVYLEDLNATNGTFKNGLRMQPYEKRKLEEGDEIKCGKVILIFR